MLLLALSQLGTATSLTHSAATVTARSVANFFSCNKLKSFSFNFAQCIYYFLLLYFSVKTAVEVFIFSAPTIKTEDRSICLLVWTRYTAILGPGYDVKLHPVTKAQFSTIEVLVAMPMTQWESRIFPCLARGNASATCLKMLVMRLADVQ